MRVFSPADHTRIASTRITRINRLLGHWSVGPTGTLILLPHSPPYFMTASSHPT